VAAGFGYDYDPGVDYAGDPAEDCEEDVQQERTAAASAQEDGEGWEEDCYEGFAAAGLDLLVCGLVGRHEDGLVLWETYEDHGCGLLVAELNRVFVSYYCVRMSSRKRERE
jgi:hypothetical protein